MRSISIKLLMCSLLGFFGACNQGDSQTDSGTEATQEKRIAKTIPAKKFKDMMKEKKGQVLDVRTPREVANGKIPEARNIDFMADGFGSKVEDLDKKEPVYIYCASGGRSNRAMKMMKEKGFTEIYELKGGFSNWKSKGYSIEE